MAYQAGSASVSITPDFRDFHSQIAEELTGLDTQFAEAGDKSGKSFADSFQVQLKGSFADLPSATVKADADTTALDTKLDESTRSRTAPVTADADTTAAEAKLTALTKPRTVRVKAVADKISGKTGTLADLFNPVAGGIAAGVALGPSALGLTAGLAGIGAGFAAAGADAGAFGVIAKGMFSDVEGAQKKLTTAQDAYNKATTDKGRAKALADEKAALAGLSPAEKDLATQLTALEGAWKKLSQAEQPVVGAALTPWLQTATSGMRLLKPLIEDGAGAVQLLGSEAKTALADPFWGQFFNTLGVTGQIALTDFGNAVGHIGDGLAHLFVTFAPDIAQVLPFVDKAATAFDKWASSVSDKGLNDFFSKTFSPANVAALAKDGKELASFVENVAKASGEMSPLAFDGLGNVLTILGGLSPGEIEALTGLFLAIKAVGTISKVASGISGAISTVKGLLGSGASTTAETTEQGTTAGDAGGAAAGAAYTAAFGKTVTGALPTAFVSIGTTGAGEAEKAGEVMGAGAAGGFASGAAKISEGLAELFGGLGAGGEGVVTGAGNALGASFAGGFAAGVAEVGTAAITGLVDAGPLAGVGAFLAGGALGLAFGGGFVAAVGASGAAGAVGKLVDDSKNAVGNSGTWLQPAGAAAAQGYAAGFLNTGPSVQAELGQVKNWTTAAGAGSNTWLAPAGQQTGQGFGTGLSGSKSLIDSIAGQLKTWVTAQLPNPLSLLVNAGISVAQGFANGISNGASLVISAAQSIANSVTSIIKSALSIGSPSKVTDQLGQFTGIGFGGGMLKTIPFVESSAGQLAAASVAGLGNLASAQSLTALGSLGVPSIGASPRLPGVGSPLSGAPLQLQLSWAGTSDQVTNALVSGLRVHIQGLNGGDVQGALGQGSVRAGI